MKGRDKGKRGEAEVSKIFGKWIGLKLRRTPSSGALAGYPADIIPESIQEMSSFSFNIEVKYHEGWSFDAIMAGKDALLQRWIKQLEEENAKIPRKYTMLFFRKNRVPWFVAIPKDQINVNLFDRYIIYGSYVIVSFREIERYEPRKTLIGYQGRNKDPRSEN